VVYAGGPRFHLGALRVHVGLVRMIRINLFLNSLGLNRVDVSV